MRISFFGSSLVSSYWNGAATYYRGIVRALADHGHSVRFYEPDAYDRQAHRDIDPPPWADVVVYANEIAAARHAVESAAGSDLIIKASGVGVFDDYLDRGVLELKTDANLVVYWDVDAPATLDRVNRDFNGAFRDLIPRYDTIFTYGGGDVVKHAYRELGARRVVPIYNAIDPGTHHPVAAESRFGADLAFLGNRLPDREERVDEFFFRPASVLPHRSFLLGGSGWEDKSMPSNVRYVGHVPTRDHNAFNASPRMVLNISRDSMATYGFSPATRVFEAAGAGACMITDAWDGVDAFFAPEREILVASNGSEVALLVDSVSRARASEIGLEALTRVRRDHTYEHRVADVEDAIHALKAALR